MLPSTMDAKTTPPAVANTPFAADPWNVLKSHIVFPVSGSNALIPVLGTGSLGPRAGGVPRPAARPMYWRPGSIVAGALMNCAPLSRYSRYTQPVCGLYDGDWKLVPPMSVGYTRKLPSGLEFDPGIIIGRPFSSNPLFQF